MADEMFDEQIGRRLVLYLTDRCSEDEAAMIREWIAVDTARAEYVEELRRIWVAAGELPAGWNSSRGWARLSHRLGTHGAPAGQPGPRLVAEDGRWSRLRRPLSAPRIAIGLAAASVLLAGSIALWRRLPASRQQAEPTAASAVVFRREVTTRSGERVAFKLPDGSRVVLAAESRLQIPASYRPVAGPRDVWLVGEAYFDVQHDSARVFRVHAANGIAEDLGTEFAVTTYPETAGVQVVVASGVVALRYADSSGRINQRVLRLEPGDLAHVDAAGSAKVKHGVRLAQYVSWARGSLVFDDAPLRAAIPRLARWYGLDIVIADERLGDRHLSATFDRESADHMLDLLAESLDLDVTRNGRAVVLSPRHHAQRP